MCEQGYYISSIIRNNKLIFFEFISMHVLFPKLVSPSEELVLSVRPICNIMLYAIKWITTFELSVIQKL